MSTLVASREGGPGETRQRIVTGTWTGGLRRQQPVLTPSFGSPADPASLAFVVPWQLPDESETER